MKQLLEELNYPRRAGQLEGAIKSRARQIIALAKQVQDQRLAKKIHDQAKALLDLAEEE